MSQAQQAFDQSAYRTAVIELKNLLQRGARKRQRTVTIRRTYLKQRDVLAAIKELETAQQLVASEAEWLGPLNRSYLLSGETDRVIETLEIYLQSAPTDHQNRLCLALPTNGEHRSSHRAL